MCLLWTKIRTIHEVRKPDIQSYSSADDSFSSDERIRGPVLRT